MITPQYIVLKPRVLIHQHCRIQGISEYGTTKYEPLIVFDEGASSQQNLHLTCAESVYIGKDTALAANVTVTDINHSYEDVRVPVERQELKVAPVYIGNGCKIYNNAVILPGVRIGDHCVVGANSVVTSDLPDYCVAAGAPACVIRHYDWAKRAWVSGPRMEDT